MRIGVLSDTHDQLPRVRSAIRLFRAKEVEVLIHCGDITSPAVLEELAEFPTFFVFGNHDADAVPDLTQAAARLGIVCLGWGDVVEFGGMRVGVCHGHMRTDLQRILAAGPSLLLSGHSLIACDRVADNGVRRINPGALADTDIYSVAVIDLATMAVSIETLSE